VDTARRWAQTAGLDAEGEIDYLREGEFIILARVLIAQEKMGRGFTQIFADHLQIKIRESASICVDPCPIKKTSGSESEER
jgi:predicted GNAT family acetyltransferase